MKIAYTLTPKLRMELKEPFGRFIEGPANETMAKLKRLVEEEKPPVVVSIGDVVSKNMHLSSVHPQITVIDNISLRSQTELPPEAHGESTIRVDNPQGTITVEAIEAIKTALAKKEHVHIIVNGEEDLLTLIAVLYAPDNAFIVYGQPRCGIVVVNVTPEQKEHVKEFLNQMKPTKS